MFSTSHAKSHPSSAWFSQDTPGYISAQLKSAAKPSVDNCDYPKVLHMELRKQSVLSQGTGTYTGV